MLGEAYTPPDQSGETKYWYLRKAAERYSTVEFPFGAKPYLCVSQEMDVTPLTRKSKGSVGKPARERKGTRKEPRQQSTWRFMFREEARRPREGMSSIIPWGKFGAEPTRRMVFVFRRRETWGMETL